MKSKKVILFIVEGITDKNSLSLILSKIIRNNNIQFQVVHGDITSNRDTTIPNCITKVNEEVKKFLDINRFRRSDIFKIIHLVDTDGAYVNEENIKKGKVEKIGYTNEFILTSNVEAIIERNKKKSKVLDKLHTSTSIGGTDYCMYYFSCNLEHVLHNTQNLSGGLKDQYSDDFADKYYGNEEEFIYFMKNSDFSVGGNYKETWDMIKIDKNSLNRYCNFSLFFDEFLIDKEN